MTDANEPTPIVPVTRYTHLWWIIDPRDRYGCCPDCQRLAAASPYTAPGTNVHELLQTPGDGRTSCGSACTCSLAYVPPHLLRWPPFERLTSEERKVRLYPKDVVLRAYDEQGSLRHLPDAPVDQPASSQQPLVTRLYGHDAHYTADALNMAAAGWRVVTVVREPSGAIVASYAHVE